VNIISRLKQGAIYAAAAGKLYLDQVLNSISHPIYQAIFEGNSGHFEALRIVYDPALLSYESLLKYFFEIHDPSQTNGQGPDFGQQYQSAIFYYDEEQRKKAEDLITDLKERGYSVATQLFSVSTFWKAESYHQHYYEKTGKDPYCHFYTKRFYT
jgi:peptide methionine sulfoxide reductase msrA/msrB